MLIHAGAGGVGSFAIQFARAAGAHVIATASGDGVAIAKRLCADQVIDYRAADFAAGLSDLDVALDTIGVETQQQSFGVLRSGGFLASTVSPRDEALAKAHGIEAAFVFHSSDAARLAAVVEKVEQGAKALVDRVAPVTAFDQAFGHQASGRARAARSSSSLDRKGHAAWPATQEAPQSPSAAPLAVIAGQHRSRWQAVVGA